MGSGRVRTILLCEDKQQEAFALRFLKAMKWNIREVRIIRSPTASGSAEQWVRKKYATELAVYRKRTNKASSALIAIIDADTSSVEKIINDLTNECTAMSIPSRKSGEAVAIIVPKRNIETWIHYLQGTQVNEEDPYPKLDRERKCQASVDILANHCQNASLPPAAPHSLQLACSEYVNLIQAM